MFSVRGFILDKPREKSATVLETLQSSTAVRDRFNASEILEITEQIKCNAATFYRKAAELFDDRQIGNMLLELAEGEAKQAAVFATMRSRLSARTGEAGTFESHNYMSDNPRAMAGLAVFGIKPDPSEHLTGHESKAEVLKRVVKYEKDTIVFYRGLEHFARDDAAKRQIDNIVKEEMCHIAALSELLGAVLAGKPAAMMLLTLSR